MVPVNLDQFEPNPLLALLSPDAHRTSGHRDLR